MTLLYSIATFIKRSTHFLLLTGRVAVRSNHDDVGSFISTTRRSSKPERTLRLVQRKDRKTTTMAQVSFFLQKYVGCFGIQAALVISWFVIRGFDYPRTLNYVQNLGRGVRLEVLRPTHFQGGRSEGISHEAIKADRKWEGVTRPN